MGVLVMSHIWDGVGGSGVNYGDGSVLLGALMYSWVTVRTSELAPGRDSTMLTCLKKVMMSMGSITWDIVQAVVRHVGMFSSGLWTGKGTAVIEAWAALMWSALVPGTLAAVLQIYAQSHVSAAESQLVYATAPVFNTIISAFALGEKLTPSVLGGGAILIFASLLPHLWPLLVRLIKKKPGVLDQPHPRSSLR
jgi:drug/metabolite transporter (DMT)-like permease